MEVSLITIQPGDHLHTYAEMSFSPLDLHGRNCSVTAAELQAFADRINRTDESGTLHPAAPISATPSV